MSESMDVAPARVYVYGLVHSRLVPHAELVVPQVTHGAVLVAVVAVIGTVHEPSKGFPPRISLPLLSTKKSSTTKS